MKRLSAESPTLLNCRLTANSQGGLTLALSRDPKPVPDTETCALSQASNAKSYTNVRSIERLTFIRPIRCLFSSNSRCLLKAGQKTARQSVRWFGDSARNDIVLEPVREIWEDREAWLAQVDKLAQKNDLAAVRTAQDHRALYETTKDALRKKIAEYKDQFSGEVNGELVDGELKKTTRSGQLWKSERQKGVRKATAGTQRFLAKFGAFIESYSGIVEVKKGVHEQVGGLAYGTLSLFLSVAMHKEEFEQTTEDALQELSLAFPRIELLRDLYPSPILEELVAVVFVGIVLFAREAVEYYQKPSLRKVLKTTGHPPKTGIVTRIDEIRRRLGEVRSESDVLAHQRIADLLGEIRKMKVTLDQLNNRSREEQLTADRRRLKKLRVTLGIDDPHPQTDLDSYRKKLDSVFHSAKSRKNEPRQMTWEMMKAEESTQRWFTCKHSSLLYLSGRNWVDVSGTTLNWLSYAALLVTEQLNQERSDVAYYCCQVDYTLTARKRCMFKELTASLVYQLAALRPEMLREGTEQIESTVRGSQWRNVDTRETPPATSNLLSEVLEAFQEDETVTLVIDRIDQCRWLGGPDDDAAALPKALESLLDVLKKARCTVKILITTSSTSACPITELDRKELRRQGKELYIKLG